MTLCGRLLLLCPSCLYGPVTQTWDGRYERAVGGRRYMTAIRHAVTVKERKY